MLERNSVEAPGVTSYPYDQLDPVSLRVLGGAFNSRINLNLREDKGYSYGARSGFAASKLAGPFTASAGVRTDSTADSVVQFMNEITGYRTDGITPEELQFTKDAIGQNEALDYETPGQKASLLEQIITYDLQSDFVRRQQDLITNLTTERVNTLARTHLPVENMIILVVGDKRDYRLPRTSENKGMTFGQNRTRNRRYNSMTKLHLLGYSLFTKTLFTKTLFTNTLLTYALVVLSSFACAQSANVTHTRMLNAEDWGTGTTVGVEGGLQGEVAPE